MGTSQPLKYHSPPVGTQATWASLDELFEQAKGDIIRLLSDSGFEVHTADHHGAEFDTLVFRKGEGEDGIIHLAHVMELNRALGSADELIRLVGQPVSGRVLRDLATVTARLREYYEPEVISDWLQGESPDLGGRQPIELIREGRLVEVLSALEAQTSGSFA